MFEPIATNIEQISSIFYFVEGDKYCQNIYNLMVDLLELVKKIAEHDINLFKLLPNPSDLVKLEAIKRNPSVIRLIYKPTIEMQLTAVKAKPFAIQMIDNPCEEVQLAAVNGRGITIEVIVLMGIVPSKAVIHAALTSMSRDNDYAHYTIMMKLKTFMC